jgi:UDP-N-acetylmuramoyl-tripeptide--D-alanyl-D-alanine ligase
MRHDCGGAGSVKLTLGRIAELISALGAFDTTAPAQGYSIDSRSIKPGELFFAVKGERLDGHDYVSQALKNGAVGAVVRRDRLGDFPDRTNRLAVEDTLAALQALATAVRKLWGKTLIGVTGSAGKTTTKEAISHVLSVRDRVFKSQGNFNNHFGLPLMLLKLEPEHDVAVIEMGMSHAGEISALAKIAEPDMGVVTNVAPVHLEFFKSLPADGVAVLNADDEYVSQFGRDFRGKVVLYGTSGSADVRAENFEALGSEGSAFDVVTAGCRVKVKLPLVGKHNVYNALAGFAVGLERKLSPTEAGQALSSLAPADKRGEVLQLGNITIINDCYNSNPKALDAMVDALAAMPAKRRIVIAGEMLELGPAGEEMHRDSGRHMADKRIDAVLGVRGQAQAIVEAARLGGIRAEFVPSADDAGEWLGRELHDGDVVLLKASRGVKLERALEQWKESISKRS